MPSLTPLRAPRLQPPGWLRERERERERERRDPPQATSTAQPNQHLLEWGEKVESIVAFEKKNGLVYLVCRRGDDIIYASACIVELVKEYGCCCVVGYGDALFEVGANCVLKPRQLPQEKRKESKEIL
ncbi:hypothetical protein GOP47_0023088 [Adiantum capillus-veneris]|uniref:Uncharacterized protein n=1 Tax=Adiantum capillus-veneris TaxID=13818 RepID=A0A9D4U8L2_ADICA|nr:hypothetical protein GOP47_0023088 [Adiantum capillus-veneris]